MTLTHCKTSNQFEANASVTYYKCVKCGKEGYIAITSAFEHTKTISGAEKCGDGNGGVHHLIAIPAP